MRNSLNRIALVATLTLCGVVVAAPSAAGAHEERVSLRRVEVEIGPDLRLSWAYPRIGYWTRVREARIAEARAQRRAERIAEERRTRRELARAERIAREFARQAHDARHVAGRAYARAMRRHDRLVRLAEQALHRGEVPRARQLLHEAALVERECNAARGDLVARASHEGGHKRSGGH